MFKAPSLPIKLTPQDDLSAADLLREAVHSGCWHDGQVPAGLPFCSEPGPNPTGRIEVEILSSTLVCLRFPFKKKEKLKNETA